MSSLSFFHSPRSVAVIGASNDPDKIGGRPIRYMRECGYDGEIYPINPSRDNVQGIEAYASIDRLPVVPDVAIVAVSGTNAVAQVVRCAELGVKGCLIMASGFGETGEEQGAAWQREMLDAASRTGMRIIGPNSQGLANFATGAVLSFSTLFTEQPPEDGPVAIVSQSGALCSVPYGLLRDAGIGVRYAHGTGNDIDVSAAELAAEVVTDPDVKLLLLYFEDIKDPNALVKMARTALDRDIPVIALMGGRSEDGQRAAASHTGALASEQRVVDSFFEKHGIWRARSTRDLVSAVEFYLRPVKPVGDELAIVSNSGAICVLAADAADAHRLPLAKFSHATRSELTQALPAFASVNNPIDVTAALLTDSSLFGRVLPVLGRDPSTNACLIGIPVSGRGYDVDRFAADATEFEKHSKIPLVLVVPQDRIAQVFRDHGLVVFSDESEAVRALAQYLKHHTLIQQARARALGPLVRPTLSAVRGTLNEAESLGLLREIGIPVVEHALVTSADEVAGAIERLGGVPVVIKGCSSDVTHKSELGLVKVGVSTVADAERVVADMFTVMEREGIANEGAIIARMVKGIHEGMLGAHLDPSFGPVVMVGAGGTYIEALPDAEVLLPPFSLEDAMRAIGRLRIAALLGGVRGEAAVDIAAWAAAAVDLGDAIIQERFQISELDVNPLMLLAADGAIQPTVQAVDAVVVKGG
ncbi:acetate--CoA ligase family protein [Microbacterium sp. LRZ72]|uniref:acetate--CoA ligase family protein n=1 Tax=Microbacterium sp. LRZ72 TaxID=2942481 RepID=UPI0029B01FC8|nr:acetate--CoA ligase family protein [Microbacterium sp. LRZ72]MDX2376117.1 acetate--CoA ligase family protein [Microbacterium sp. LRZ72]